MRRLSGSGLAIARISVAGRNNLYTNTAMNTLQCMHNAVEDFFFTVIERFPRSGYLFASIPAGSAVANMLDQLRGVLSVASLVVGLVVGLYAVRAHHLQIKKTKAELDQLSKRRRP